MLSFLFNALQLDWVEFKIFYATLCLFILYFYKLFHFLWLTENMQASSLTLWILWMYFVDE